MFLKQKWVRFWAEAIDDGVWNWCLSRYLE